MRDIQTALVLLLERDIGRLLVDSDPEALEFGLDDALVCEGLVDVEDNEDEMAGLGHGNDLPASATAVFGALDDTG